MDRAVGIVIVDKGNKNDALCLAVITQAGFRC